MSKHSEDRTHVQRAAAGESRVTILRRRRGYYGTLFFRRDLALPGDVLLTGAAPKNSRATALLTHGPFSHAALVVRSSRLLESDRYGTGPGGVPLRRVEISENGRRELCELVGVRYAVGLRHPGLATRRPEDVEFQIETAARTWLYREYPALVELAPAIRSGVIRSIVDHLILPYRAAGPRDNAGPFCSEFIALVFTSIELPLFADRRGAQTVSPNSLLDSELVPVPGLVCYAEPSANIDAWFAENDTFRAAEQAMSDRSTTRLLVEARTHLFRQAHGVRQYGVAIQRAVDALIRLYGDSGSAFGARPPNDR